MLIKAPFTFEQVEMMNEYQEMGVFHPYTCPRDRSNLYATPAGWVCLRCTYTQDSVHDFVIDPEAHHEMHLEFERLDALMRGALDNTEMDHVQPLDGE
jgi:hypothetical protein